MGNSLTPKFRVSYPNVLRARLNDLSGKEEFSLTALFSKDADLAGLKKAAKDCIEAKWGVDSKKWPKNLRSPFRKHEERAFETDDGKTVFPQGMEAGGIFLNLKSSQKPGLVDQSVADIISETDFYPGCYARATVRPYAYEMKGNAGVSFGLQNIQKIAEGESLGSRTRPQDDFAPIAGVAHDGADATTLFT